MLFKSKSKPAFNVATDYDLSPSEPFIMNHGDPVTIGLTRSLDHLKQNRDQLFKRELRR